ncbi:MAG: hypothetical protein WAM97_21105 [Acidimicrobiales bacterium]
MTAPVAIGGGQVHLDEVYLSGATAGGPAVVGGLALTADQRGLAVLGPEPSSVRTIPWTRATTIACRRSAQLPDGRDAVSVEIAIDGLSLRFLVPSVDLGPQGAEMLEAHLAGLARIPIGSPDPAVQAAASGGGLPPGVQAAPSGGGLPPGVQAPSSGPITDAAGGNGLQNGVNTLAPAAGGTLTGLGSHAGGQYVKPKKVRRGRGGKRIAAVVVVVAIVVGGAGYYFVKHKSSSSGSSAADATAAAAANITPGDLPGWKGVPGTMGGALGASGLSSAVGTTGSVTVTAAAAFAKCTSLTAGDVDPVLAVLGFSDGLSVEPEMTAQSTSLLYEDPSVVSTSAESSAIVLQSIPDETADLSMLADPVFSTCYRAYLVSVIPALVGGPLSGGTVGAIFITPPKVTAGAGAGATGPTGAGSTVSTGAGSAGTGSVAAGNPVSTAETIQIGMVFDKTAGIGKGLYSENVNLVGGGRIIAALETMSQQPFPATTAAHLLAGVQQSVAAQS